MGFVEPLKDVSVPEKKQAKFECTLTKEVPKVMWFRGAEVVTPGPKYELIDDGNKHMLIINSCEFDDESDYTVEVAALKSTARLSVEGKGLPTRGSHPLPVGAFSLPGLRFGRSPSFNGRGGRFLLYFRLEA